jgi:predicted dehydrogenase
MVIHRVCTFGIQNQFVLRFVDLANDANVDLVVCSVRVDSHYQTVKPSIIAGKSIFVEWPLEKNLAIAKKMAELAVKHKAKTIVGLQASFDPTVRKLKEYVQGGKLGKLLSSSFVTSLGNGGVTESSKVSYFLDREVGGSIHVGHMLEGFASGMAFFSLCRYLLTSLSPRRICILQQYPIQP